MLEKTDKKRLSASLYNGYLVDYPPFFWLAFPAKIFSKGYKRHVPNASF